MVIISLHNITPHLHEDSSSQEAPSKLLDWLQFAFQVDPENAHLECFSEAPVLDADFDHYVFPHEDFVVFDPINKQDSALWITGGAYYLE